MNTRLLTYNEENYPQKLKNIYDSPMCLFYKGNISLLNRKIIAVVGCRDCSNYGAKVAFEIAYGLSKNNIIVISGGARGIDSYAHKGAIMIKNQ